MTQKDKCGSINQNAFMNQIVIIGMTKTVHGHAMAKEQVQEPYLATSQLLITINRHVETILAPVSNSIQDMADIKMSLLYVLIQISARHPLIISVNTLNLYAQPPNQLLPMLHLL